MTAGGSGRVADRAELYDRYGAVAFSLCLAIVGDEAAASDIVCGCFRAAPERASGEVHDWLLAEVHRRAIAVVGRNGVARTVDQRVLASEWLGAFRMLDAEQRLMVSLAYYHGLTVAHIAHRLAISPQRVVHVLAGALEGIRVAPSLPFPRAGAVVNGH